MMSGKLHDMPTNFQRSLKRGRSDGEKQIFCCTRQGMHAHAVTTLGSDQFRMMRYV